MLDKYQLTNCIDFYGKYAFPDVKSKHTADVAISYYYYAYYQMMSLSTTYVAFFKEQNPSNDEVMHYLRQSWSYAFSMYAMLRTMLDALRIMRQMIGDTTPVDASYEENIKRIIDIANDIVKHPTYKVGVASEACEPLALSLNGEIDIIVWSNTGQSSKMELSPMKDFEVVHNYAEYITARLLPN